MGTEFINTGTGFVAWQKLLEKRNRLDFLPCYVQKNPDYLCSQLKLNKYIWTWNDREISEKKFFKYHMLRIVRRKAEKSSQLRFVLHSFLNGLEQPCEILQVL